MELETLIDIYKEQILCLVDAGADLLVVETMMSLAETRAALIAAKEVCDLPVIATLTFEADGRTLFGTDAKTAAIMLESLGASAIGANCSTGPAQMENIISKMVSHTRIPVIANPMPDFLFWMKTELPATTWKQKSLQKRWKYWSMPELRFLAAVVVPLRNS